VLKNVGNSLFAGIAYFWHDCSLYQTVLVLLLRSPSFGLKANRNDKFDLSTVSCNGLRSYTTGTAYSVSQWYIVL